MALTKTYGSRRGIVDLSLSVRRGEVFGFLGPNCAGKTTLRGGVDAAAIDGLGERLQRDVGERIGSLSHGNRQKIGLIQAFMHRPELLILDEPTQGLDPLLQRRDIGT